jgi:hypothetical protein
MTTLWDESYPPSLFVPPEPPVIPVSGVTAGVPGAFTPANATSIPANLAALQADPIIGNAGTSKPGAAWTVGQYVDLGDASDASWNGTAWVAGAVPVEFLPETTSEKTSKRKESRTHDDS